MRIAQIAPLWEEVPPKAYGGTELVVHLLTEELVKRGHEVTLFAAGTNHTSAKFFQGCRRPFREIETELQCDKTHAQIMAYELNMLSEIFSRAHQFDVIHNHMGFSALPLANYVSTPVVTTLHNTLQPEIIHHLFKRHRHLPCISISNYQRELWPELNYAATIYQGIKTELFQPNYNPSSPYLAFLGRLSPEKGPHHAIQIAKSLGMKLIMAGKIDRVDRIYYERDIAHWVDGEQISYIGEVNHEQKEHLLRNAAATLCPVSWPEPFGLVMIESMACGTPVFALRNGSTPEVIDHGQSGYVADSVDELISALKSIKQYDRRLCRQIAEKRFSVERMVDAHEELYDRLSKKHSPERLKAATVTPTGVAYAKRSASTATSLAPSVSESDVKEYYTGS